MPEPTQLHPTKVRLRLLADVRDLNVYDNLDGIALLDLGEDGTATVHAAIREFEQAGWVYMPDDTNGWRLTQRGLDILEGRR